MSAAHEHGLSRRVIFVAAVLSERYLNPEVAAYSRSRRSPVASSSHKFWSAVGRAVYRHPYGCPTKYEIAVRRDIDTARAAIAKVFGQESAA